MVVDSCTGLLLQALAVQPRGARVHVGAAEEEQEACVHHSGGIRSTTATYTSPCHLTRQGQPHGGRTEPLQ